MAEISDGNLCVGGGTHPVAQTGDTNVADISVSVEVGDANARVDSGGPHPAVPALDSDILAGVRALNRYPQRTKNANTLNDTAKAENVLAKRITTRWLDLLPSTRSELEALQLTSKEAMKRSLEEVLLQELRNFGRRPIEYRKLNAATPAHSPGVAS